LIRNPIYTAIIIFIAKLAIALGSDGCLVVPATLILHFGVMKREGQYPKTKFGERYRSYKQAVRRYRI